MAEVDSARSECCSSSKNFPNHLERHVTDSKQLIGRREIDLVTRQDEDGDTLLHVAVSKGNLSACFRLVSISKSARLSLDVRNNILQTPLHVACIVDAPQIIELLLSASPSSCNVTDRHGNNCIHLAIKHGNKVNQPKSLQVVLQFASAETLEKKNLDGYTPMHLGAIHGKPEAIKLLKKAGASINALDNRGGATPLILATKASQQEAAQALLELGGNPTLRTTYGETASQLASAKGDHVISELLALYDSSGDVGKTPSLSRFINENSAAANRNTNKQHPGIPRHRDVKMKSFVSSRMLHLPPPKIAPIPRPHLGPPSSLASPLVVKSERFSPADAFPSNVKQAVASSNQRNETAPLDFAIRRQKEASPSEAPKRKFDTDERPLDLSVKKSRVNPPTPVPALSVPDSLRSAPKHPSFVQPAQPHAVSPLVNSTIRHQSPIANVNPFTPVAAIKRQRSTDASHLQALHSSLSLLAARSPGALSTFGGRIGELQQLLLHENNRANNMPHENGRSKEIEVKPNRAISDKRREFAAKEELVSRNGVFYPVQAVDSIPANYHHSMISKNAPYLPDNARSPSIRKHSVETRTHVQHAKMQTLDSRNQTHAVADRLTKRYLFNKGQQSVEKNASLSPDFRPQSPAKKVETDRESSSNREKRFPSDSTFPNRRRSRERHFAIRRNSAPMAIKASNEKIDLRSYTGCLPPHYLHLLESSGNLPIRASNALRSVSDVLQDNVITHDVNLEDKKPPEKSPHHPHAHSLETPNTVATSSIDPKHSSVHLFPPAPRIVPGSSTSSSTTPSTSFSNTKPSCLPSQGGWHNIESGEYPAFGKPVQISPEKIKPPPARAVSEEKLKLDEKYFSENTRKILKNAHAGTPAKRENGLCLRNVVIAATRHSCRGCTRQKKRIPPLIADIWRYQPSSKYVSSSTTTSEVIFCWQLQSPVVSSPTQQSIINGKKPPVHEINSCLSVSSTSQTNHVSSPRTRNGSLHFDAPSSKLNSATDMGSIFDRVPLIKNNFNGSEKSIEIPINSTRNNREPVLSHATHNGVSMTVNNLAFSSENGLHEKILTEVIRKNFIKNLECYNEVVVQKFKSAGLHSAFANESKDTYKDLHLSDLEISDDEVEQSSRKKSD